MNYRYVRLNQDGAVRYNIVENLTDLIIKEGLSLSEAKSETQHLNRGGGFAGWTPSFFLVDFPVTYTEA